MSVEVLALFVSACVEKWVRAAINTHQDADRPAGHLAKYRNPALVEVGQRGRHGPPHLGVSVDLAEVEHHGPSGSSGQFFHPGQLHRNIGMPERTLKHSMTHAPKRVAERVQLVNRASSSWNQLAGDRFVQRRPRGREPERPTSEPFFDQFGHRSEVIVGCYLVRRATLAHDVCAQRTMCDLRTHVHGVLPRTKGIEVLWKRFPLPGNSIDHRRAGDVFDTLHQADEPLVRMRLGRREPDATVAHHDGGATMPRRRCQPRIPTCLSVVVRVNVDKAGSDQQTLCIDGPTRRSQIVTWGVADR